MHKKQKNQLIVLMMVFLMFGSSFAFILLGVEPEQAEEQQELQYTYEESIPDQTRNNLLSNGFTILSFHYNGSCCEDTIVYLDQIPNDDSLKYQSITQIIVEKLTDSKEPKIIAESMYDLQETNRTSMQDIFRMLCNVLVAPPTECGFLSLNWTDTNISEANLTNAIL